ncbi:MAG: hypothetical protein ACR2QM_16835 [Longimicrobiales bacterium]
MSSNTSQTRLVLECCGYAVLSLVGSAVLAALTRIPAPYSHDQFSYLLLGDTFASGRPANPTPPFWEHFETFHVLFEPTYVSKYPVMQGLFLALGQVLSGAPILGVWISTALLCAATYWMLRGWLPAGWARVGAAVGLLQWGIVGYWAQSYWGGAAAALGGCLVIGALPRLIKNPTLGLAITFGVGSAVLANSRPLEGVILFGWVTAAILVALARRPAVRVLFQNRSLPALVVLGLTTLLAMASYNQATTGTATQMPYQLHSALYKNTTFIPFKAPPVEPEYRREIVRDFYREWSGEYMKDMRRPWFFFTEAVIKAANLMMFFTGVTGFIALLALPKLWKERRYRWGLCTVSSVLGVAFLTRGFPHYVAPVGPLILLLYIAALAAVTEIDRPFLRGRFLVRVSLAVISASFVVRLGLHAGDFQPYRAFRQDRARVVATLAETPKPDLVFVRYEEGHDPHQEWVFNGASLPNSEIIWALDLGPEANARLLGAFGDRSTWLLTVSPTADSDSVNELVSLIPYDADEDETG